MTDYLLRGLEEIHKALFTGVDGKVLTSFESFRKKDVPDLKRLGLVRKITMGRGKQRTSYLCGWKAEIKKYFILKGQEEFDEKNGMEGGDASV